MEARKTIELIFSDDNVSSVREIQPVKAGMACKMLNIDGLTIEIMQPAAKKVPKSIDLNFGDENSGVKVNNGVAATKPKETRPPKPAPAHLKMVSVIPKKILPEVAAPKKLSKVPLKLDNREKINEPTNGVLDEAAGLWAQLEANVSAPKIPELKTEPVVTEEDWESVKKVIFSAAQSEMSEYDRLLEMSKSRLNKNQEDFLCSICEQFVVKGKGVLLKGCLHNICKLCLKDEILTNFDDMGQVKCPFRGVACDSKIDDDEVKEMLGDDFHEFSLKILESLNEKVRESDRLAEAAKNDTMPLLLDAENHDFIENRKVFECAICFTDAEVGDGVILKNCLHNFCKLCLIEQVINSEEFEVKCPNNDDDGSCQFKLQEREVKALVTPEIFEKHLEKSLKLYEAAAGSKNYHCKTADCRGFYELMDANVRGFTCEVCEKVNCIGCKAIHQGKNCQEYQDELNPDAKSQRENAESEKAIQNMIAAEEAMWCPRCGILVTKADGCDYITCSACKLGICWRTKKPRQPINTENGLVIDGCHCMEKGVRCHPQCGNCH